MKRWLLAFLLSLAAAPGWAGEIERLKACAADFGVFKDWNQSRVAIGAVPRSADLGHLFSFFKKFFPSFRDLREAPIRQGFSPADESDVVARLDLAGDLDKYLATTITFQTRRGKTVHISANRVSNCTDGTENCPDYDRYFILFFTDQGELFSADIYHIANYSIFKSGQKEIAFDNDGDKYIVKLHVGELSMNGAMKSVLEISRNGQAVFSRYPRFGEIIDAMSMKGVPVTMDRQYRAFLNRYLYQDQNQECYFGKTAFLALIPEGVQDVDDNYLLDLAAIPAQGVLFPAQKDFAFRKSQDKSIEIYRAKSR